MYRWDIDWRWTAALLLGGVVLSQAARPFAAALLAVAVFLVFRVGYLAWSRGPIRGRKVKETYWRGRRID